MPFKGLRSNRSEKNLRRRSTLDPSYLFRQRDRTPDERDPEELLGRDSGIGSQDGAPSDYVGQVRRMSAFHPEALPDTPPSSLKQEHAHRSKRLSMLLQRNASEPYLLMKAKEQEREQAAGSATPPLLAPSIVTTAPPVDLEPSQPKKRIRFQSFRRSKSSAGLMFDKSTDKDTGSGRNRTTFGNLKSRDVPRDEPGRLSTSSARTAPPRTGQEANPPLAPPASRRISDSSQSRYSRPSEDHAQSEGAATTNSSHTNNAFSWLSRRSKHRASLFPLPVKIPPPLDLPDTASSSPRPSTSAVSWGESPRHSPSTFALLPTTDQQSFTPYGYEDGTPSPLPSPSHTGALVRSSIGIAAPGMLRNDSTTSAQSSQSSPAFAPSALNRLRSSTMGSTGALSENGSPLTPPLVSESGRNSSSTTGRSSLGNLFSRTPRLRPSSEQRSRQESPVLPDPKEANALPGREEGETPLHYLARVEEVFDRRIIARVMSKSNDEFSAAVLRSFMRRFTFFGDPLDMALRKLLMAVELPVETQQIDRVLMSFADRYHECNPGIYIASDQAYFMTFSLLMLHTDLFNPNNKRKMTKADFIKLSVSDDKDECVAEDVRACFYDNIAYTPFIKVEDDFDLRGLGPRKGKKTKLKGAIAEPVRKATKEPIDPYALIFESKLDTLRPPIKDVLSFDDPYTYLGTAPNLDMKNLLRTYKIGVLQVVSGRSRPRAFMSPTTVDNPEPAQAGLVDVPVYKVGILRRKDPKKKKPARSPWQEWGAVLTGKGLSFYKNRDWVKTLIHQYEMHQKQGHPSSPVVFKPPIPDTHEVAHLLPVEGGVALQDRNYKNHKNAFVFFRYNGAEETFLADSEAELNDWMARLNHHAAFKTANIEQRGAGSHYEGQRQRGMRRVQSASSTKSIQTPTGEVTIRSGMIDNQLAQQISLARREKIQRKISEAEDKLGDVIKQLERHERDARHLQILAPIQQKTREQVVHAAGRMAAHMKWVRIDIWRMKCHRDILALDLEDERRSVQGVQPWNQRFSEPPLPPLPISLSVATNPRESSELDRLGSRASTAMSTQRSPTTSMRPDTKSSHGAESGGGEVVKMPPGQSSPTFRLHPAGPPSLSIDTRTDHRASAIGTLPRSPHQNDSIRRPSTSSVGDQLGSPSISPYATQPSDGAEHDNKAGAWVQGPDSRLDTGSDSDGEPTTVTGSPQSRSRVRRSLHRTLRSVQDSPLTHHRSRKGKDSSSSAVVGEGAESPDAEGLTRSKGSFTVHGKKASVITLGTEWQNMSAEERLRARKHLPSDDPKLVVPDAIEDEVETEAVAGATANAPARSSFLTTTSTASALSFPGEPYRDATAIESDNNPPVTFLRPSTPPDYPPLGMAAAPTNSSNGSPKSVRAARLDQGGLDGIEEASKQKTPERENGEFVRVHSPQPQAIRA